tara:strand:- start:102 stop:542 length:441 start_codon:yes stop_codon:yes gene_type:complete
MIISLVDINYKNQTKTSLYLFNSKSKELSLGHLITGAFLTGLTISTTSLIIFNQNPLSNTNKNKFSRNQNYETSENIINEENINDNYQKVDIRPPERDIRDSHPTISVNYRIIDTDNISYKDQNTIPNDELKRNSEDDWGNNDRDW